MITPNELLDLFEKDKHDFTFKIFDWEGLSFPITFSDIVCQRDHYRIPQNAKLTIWRDINYQLQGTLEGVISNESELEYRENGEVKNLGFINDEILSVTDGEEKYFIEGFSMGSVNFLPVEVNGQLRLRFKCEITLNSVNQWPSHDSKADKITEWYLCSMPDVLFPNRTERFNAHPRYKIRVGLDEPVEDKIELLRTGYSSAWDYCVVQYEGYKIIVQQIGKKYLPEGSDGLAIEYRALNSKFPDDEFRLLFREYLSFMLGSHIKLIGTSQFSANNNLIHFTSQSPWGKHIRKTKTYTPIPLKNGPDRALFEKLLNKYLQNFINLSNKTELSSCLWKLWTGMELPIGINLPIIASGLEILIDSYLKNEKVLRRYSAEEKEQYNSLIEKELAILKEKLGNYDFGKFVINKIENPYNYGIGEKMNLFFSKLSLKFDKNSPEAQALKARNLMTHQPMTFEHIEEQRKIIKLSDAYITLMNRIILILLKYDWYYIDYSKEGIRYLPIDKNL